MVGGRRRVLESTGSLYSNGANKGDDGYSRSDLEAAYGSLNKHTPRQRFRDAISSTTQDKRTAEMKKRLIDNVDHEALEKFRKSEESVRSTER
jgi:nucleosome binding factor SPN SPT16 subunit